LLLNAMIQSDQSTQIPKRTFIPIHIHLQHQINKKSVVLVIMGKEMTKIIGLLCANLVSTRIIYGEEDFQFNSNTLIQRNSYWLINLMFLILLYLDKKKQQPGIQKKILKVFGGHQRVFLLFLINQMNEQIY
ncbi:MAG: hypothetical protein EZS28_048073, partial [Streblomastix strix]